MTGESTREYTEVVRGQSLRASKKERSRILDEFKKTTLPFPQYHLSGYSKTTRPLFPPLFLTRRTPPICIPASTPLHMS